MSQSFWAGVYRNWFWIGPPLGAAAIAALGLLIPGLVALVKRGQLFQVPLADSQEVRFAEAGTVSLSIEGPRGTTRFAKVSFELRGAGGEAVEGKDVWFRTKSSGMSTARTELLQFEIPRPGTYVLAMKGLGAAQPGDAEHKVAFSRPQGVAMVAFIVGIILAAGVLTASVVFLALRAGKPGLAC